MAVATITDASITKELKSCPPDGYVVIRRMTYGESLKRKEIMASIAMQMNGKKGEGATMQMDLLQEKTALWEFANLIIDHNLTDAKDRKLNFKDANDVKSIRGQVGDEIQLYINEINSFEEDEDVKN